MTPGRKSLDTILKGCGITLPDPAVDALWAYHQMLREANARLNLTRIHQFDNMVLKHYVDSLLVLRFEELPSPLVDMGSGPGLPGVPLAIARPDVRMILAEPRGARAEFLREVVDRLALPNVEVYANKVNARFPHRVRGVITRAVASIPETLDRVAHAIEPGGRMLFMKGPDCEEEIAEARRTHASLFSIAADHAYTIPATTHDRRLVVYERTQAQAPAITRGDDEPSREYEGLVRDVTSEANPTFKLARDLLTGRGIRKHGLALMSGSRAVAEVLARFPERIEGWVTNSGGPPPPAGTGTRHTWHRLSDSLFREVDTAGTHAPLLLVRVPTTEPWNPAEPWPEGCTLFIPFQDPENVGAVIRSAAAFGVRRVVLLREAAHPFHPKSVRAAGPAVFQVELRSGPSIHDLDAGGVPLIALDAEGPDLASSPFPERFGLVPGVEGPGLPDSLRGGLVRSIPIAPGVESLNAAAATAVALYAWRRAAAE
ncbi:MAG TPA: 16S rRNA (guanine(527)-N(7))-methyltransferase RsmG [Isosphaeraceae bacterium]